MKKKEDGVAVSSQPKKRESELRSERKEKCKDTGGDLPRMHDFGTQD